MKAFINWSGGKDAALCLWKARQEGLPVEALVTTVSAATDRVTMHGVQRRLLEAQAAAIGLPLHVISLPAAPGMEAYETAIGSSNRQLKEEGFTHVLSGDLFLDDLRTYRETLYAKDGLQPLFPLWRQPADQLIENLLTEGFRALTVAVNAQWLDAQWCGRELNADFFTSLPPGVDPCGENGEYHSFVFDGPLFRQALPFTLGGQTYKEYPSPVKQDCFQEKPAPAAGFYFQELLPVE
jgi:uncharacterized protein (TIGR00290 family)